MYSIDLNQDGFNEIVFPVHTGFGISPRAIFAFDIHNSKVFSSIVTGSPNFDLIFYDLDGDEHIEIISSSSAPNNMDDSQHIPLRDNQPWLKVYTSELNFLFDPVPFPKGEGSGLYCCVDTSGEYSKIVGLYSNRNDKRQTSFIANYDLNGDELKKTALNLAKQRNRLFLIQDKFGYLVFDGTNRVLKFNKDLDFIDEIHLKVGELFPFLTDIDENSKNEVVLLSEDLKNLIIYSDDFKKYNILEFDEKINYHKDYFKLAKNEFYLTSDSRSFIYRYELNYLYFLKYPLYLIIYLTSAAFIYLIQWIQYQRLKEKYELQNQVRNLELKSFRSQMDPHFMFNAFTSLASLLKKGQQEEVYDAFIRFSKMARVNLDDSGRIIWTLKEELQVITDFLELNKLRFKEKLEYSINISEGINTEVMIPKMVLQIHVENALKHGLSRKKGKGFITVSVNSDGSYLKLVVEDNGIGRENAAGLNQSSTKKGLKMLQAIYNHLNQNNKHKITQHFVDLTDEKGNPAGTRVEIRVPINLK